MVDKVVRLIPVDNMKYLPKGKSTLLSKYTRQAGVVKVEIDFKWIRNNTGLYNRLMGRR